MILGALLHMFVQFLESRRLGFVWQPIIDWHSPELKKIFKLFLPRVIGMDISQVSLIIATTVGSILTAGSVTIFTAANNLAAVPFGDFCAIRSHRFLPAAVGIFCGQKPNRFFGNTRQKHYRRAVFYGAPVRVNDYFPRLHCARNLRARQF